MKNRVIVIFVTLFIFVLTGCNNDESGQEGTEETGEKIAEQKETPSEDESEEPSTDSQQEADIAVEETEEENVDEADVTEVEKQKEPQYELIPENWNLTPISDANEQVVLLTIDDAPDQYTLEMAKTLKSLGAPAIFFVNGHFLETDEEKEILKQIHEMGFSIGNHTYTHQKLDDVSEDKQKEEILSLSNRIEEIIGERPKFFRAPHGVNTDFVTNFVKEEGMLLMNWTYGYDYFKPYMDAEKLTTAMVTGEGPEVDVPYSLLKPGANLLMHDREWTAAALEDIVKGLRKKGYEMLDPNLIKTP
ncbi:polysaccharide deacetylase family protein [Aquibacillus rhizosphaerae]|uniref:Polysaccharide deacetylase family protein n=1 Tax=Aquibacillus rhizosphaerae TaxID=3051431 RepID=A0ABT7L9S5_9BACI|nr:polysaccharide deacetylase family protein [Aquibacillus sp. LR5S19]MDL4841315.1 polysaccharide deacetylase family protein [Aquibacillus sp. LR5S19]